MFGIFKRNSALRIRLRAAGRAFLGLVADELPSGLMHISIVHLPERLHRDGADARELEEAPGVRMVDDDDWLIYTGYTWLQTEEPEVAAIRAYAQAAGCSWVLVDDCAPIVEGLPTYGEDFDSPYNDSLRCRFCGSHTSSYHAPECPIGQRERDAE